MESLQLDWETRVRVADRMERLPITRRHWLLVAFIFMGWFSENIDLGGNAFLLPTIRSAFSLSEIVGGYYTSIAFVGMFIGSLLGGPISDRVGRKKVIVVSMCLWGIIGALMSVAPNITVLFILRFFLGLGLGAQMPVAMTYLSESVPSTSRAKFLALFQLFSPLGVAAAGFLTIVVLPHFSWQGVYFAEALPALFVIGIIKYCPESALWLESRGRLDEADALCAKWEEEAINEKGKLAPVVVSGPRKTAHGSTRDLFTRKYAGVVALTFVIMFFGMLGDYGLTTWLTTLLMAKGFSVIKSVGFVSLGILGGIPAFFFASWATEKLGRKKTFLIGSVVACAFGIIYGASATMATLIIFGILYQFGKYVNAMNNAIYFPELFDTYLRGSGTALAMAFGRLGAIVGPIVMAGVFAGWGANAAFYVAAVLLGLGGVSVFLFGPETKGKRF